MTIRYSVNEAEYRIVCNAAAVPGYLSDLEQIGAHVLEIISPPPGKDDRNDGEDTETILGVKCFASDVSCAGRKCRMYRFTVPGWAEAYAIGKRDAKRMIHGRLEPYVLNTMGKLYGLTSGTNYAESGT